jgi:hypothetical protein
MSGLQAVNVIQKAHIPANGATPFQAFTELAA